MLELDSRQKDAEIISEILLKAASEPDFRKMLVRDSGKVLDKFNLSIQAKKLIKSSIIDLM